MAEDSFTETTGQSWFSRLVESIKGVLFGVLLFVVALPLLVWNEGRAVRTAKTLQEGASAVVSVPADRVDSGRAGKLVHMTGEATTTETLSDPEFGVALPAIKLQRRVEMYQWKEEKESHTRSKLGGGTETVTTYTYKQAWSPDLVDSSAFKKRDGHQNPSAMPVSSQSWTATKVTLGAFTLSEAQVGLLNRFQDLPVGEEAAAAVAPDLKEKAKLHSGGYYWGADPASPAIGDAKVSFQVVRPATVSIVARQMGDTFEAYQAQAGGSILLLEPGTVSADSMFKTAEESNTLITWVLRLVGFLVMFVGLSLVFKPFEIFVDVIPFLGTLLGAGIGLFAGMVAASLTLLTIAVSWLVYRPLIGIFLLLLAAGGMAGLIHLAKQRRAKRKLQKQQPQMPETPAAAA
jgi:hypothetical protein